jgi:hypothetical protein
MRKWFFRSGFGFWFKNAFAFFLGLIFVLIGLFLAQFIYVRSMGVQPNQVSQEVSTMDYSDTTSRTYGWTTRPNVRSTVTRFLEHWPIYEYTLRTDNFGRRVVFPGNEKTQKDQFLIYLGCSFMFGQGLEDEATLDYQLTRRLKRYQSYNYSVPGYGLGHVLAQAQNIDFTKQIPQRQGLIIYLYPTFHIDRMVGGLETIDWAVGLPYFRLEGDKLVRDGFVHEERYIYAAAERLYNKTFLRRRFNLAWPFQIDRDDLELACKAISEVKQKITSHFNDSRFLLVLQAHSIDKDISFCLAKYGIEWLDMRGALRGYRFQDLGIKGDGHPTELANKLTAEGIAQYLNSREKNHVGTRN